MWVLDDNAMEKLLGGDFCEVKIATEEEENISIRKLSLFQFKYDSYQGFRKFFKKHLEPILKTSCYIDDTSFVSKIIRKLCDM